MLSLDSGISIQKKRILATPQSTLTNLNQSLLKNNLQSLYELLFYFFLLFMQPQLLIQILCTKISFQPFLMTQLLQNTSLQKPDSLWTLIVFSILITESMYYLLVISIQMFSSIIMIIFQLAISVRTKHQNQFTTNISGLIYNNFASPISLVYNLSYNIASLTDLSNNSLFSNDYGIPFLLTSLRNFHYFLGLTLFWL